MALPVFKNSALDYQSTTGYIACYRYFLLNLLSNHDLQLATWSLFGLNSIYPCATNFTSPFMLAFLGYRHYSFIACKDNGKAEFLLPEKVILTTLLPFSLTGLTFLAKIYLVVTPRRLLTGLVTWIKLEATPKKRRGLLWCNLPVKPTEQKGVVLVP